MNALIIAAGMGTRLGQDQHKCLTPVHGRPLINHILESLAVCGCHDAWIVTGWQGEQLQQALGDKRCHVRLHFVHNPDFRRGNGISVLRGIDALPPGAEFLLLMSDHLVSPDLVHRVWRQRRCDCAAAVGIDRDAGSIHDLDDGMKVQIDDVGKVTAIAKTLATYTGIDCGVFACSPAFANYLRAAQAAGEESLSQACARAAADGSMGTVEITGLPWHDIDTADGLQAAEPFYFARHLRRSARSFACWLAGAVVLLLLIHHLFPVGSVLP
ncbi:MAG TPA: NTP transferase domain-containing protein [bacterium]|nr:NTP transferase domain-containing protein [bacterium]